MCSCHFCYYGIIFNTLNSSSLVNREGCELIMSSVVGHSKRTRYRKVVVVRSASMISFVYPNIGQIAKNNSNVVCTSYEACENCLLKKF